MKKIYTVEEIQQTLHYLSLSGSDSLKKEAGEIIKQLSMEENNFIYFYEKLLNAMYCHNPGYFHLQHNKYMETELQMKEEIASAIRALKTNQ